MSGTTWTDERVALLRIGWDAGKSCSVIAAEMGGVTRNAVIGKAHRLGLESRPSPIKFAADSTRTALRRITAAHKEISTIVPPLFDDTPPPTAKRTKRSAILGSSTADCQWPSGHVGEPGFHLCGEPSKADRPYCPKHCKLAYLPPKQKAA